VLGLYATKSRTASSSSGSPTAGRKKADLRTGDIILSVAGKDVRDLAGFFRRIWAQGQAGVDVPITIIATARAWSCASNRASAIGSSRGRVCIEGYDGSNSTSNRLSLRGHGFCLKRLSDRVGYRV